MHPANSVDTELAEFQSTLSAVESACVRLASAAPISRRNKPMATATAGSKKFEMPISAAVATIENRTRDAQAPALDRWVDRAPEALGSTSELRLNWRKYLRNSHFLRERDRSFSSRPLTLFVISILLEISNISIAERMKPAELPTSRSDSVFDFNLDKRTGVSSCVSNLH